MMGSIVIEKLLVKITTQCTYILLKARKILTNTSQIMLLRMGIYIKIIDTL